MSMNEMPIKDDKTSELERLELADAILALYKMGLIREEIDENGTPRFTPDRLALNTFTKNKHTRINRENSPNA